MPLLKMCIFCWTVYSSMYLCQWQEIYLFIQFELYEVRWYISYMIYQNFYNVLLQYYSFLTLYSLSVLLYFCAIKIPKLLFPVKPWISTVLRSKWNFSLNYFNFHRSIVISNYQFPQKMDKDLWNLDRILLHWVIMRHLLEDCLCNILVVHWTLTLCMNSKPPSTPPLLIFIIQQDHHLYKSGV